MTAPFSTRRHADEFEALVSRRVSHDEPLTERDAARFARLLEVVEDLRALPEVAPRPEFVADLRSRLMAEADTVLLPVDRATETRLTLVPGTGSRTNRRLGVVLGGAAMVGAAASMAVAAQSALPGEMLYPVKRALEGAEARMATSEASRGSALLANATGRLEEVEALSSRGTPESAAAVPATLTDFQEQALEAADVLITAYEQTGDKTVITDLRTFTAESIGHLQDLDAQVPDIARDELVEAGLTLARIDERAEEICSTCEGGLDKLPTFLLTAGKASAGVVPTGGTGGRLDEFTLGSTGSQEAKGSTGSPRPVPTQESTTLEVPELGVTGSVTGPGPVPGTGPGPVPGTGPGTGPGTTSTQEEPTGSGSGSQQVKGPLEEVKKVLGGKESVTTTVTDPVTSEGGVLDTTDEVLEGVTGTTDDLTGGATDGLTSTTEGLTGATGSLTEGLTGGLTEGLTDTTESGTGLLP